VTREQIEREVRVLQTLKSVRGVVQLREYFMLDSVFHELVFELANEGTLQNLLEESKLSEATSRVLFNQLAKAVKQIHSHNIVHRDIKCDNVLLFKRANQLEVKLCDFGYARYLAKRQKLNDACGSPLYCPPELTIEGKYDGFKADVWSLGVTLYCMVFGCYPFSLTCSNTSDLDQMVSSLFIQIRTNEPRYNVNEVSISKDLHNLLRSLLEKNPDKRNSIGKIVKHPWLKSSLHHLRCWKDSLSSSTSYSEDGSDNDRVRSPSKWTDKVDQEFESSSERSPIFSQKRKSNVPTKPKVKLWRPPRAREPRPPIEDDTDCDMCEDNHLYSPFRAQTTELCSRGKLTVKSAPPTTRRPHS